MGTHSYTLDASEMDMDERIRSRSGRGRQLAPASSSFPLIFVVAVFSLTFGYFFIPTAYSFSVPSSSIPSMNGSRKRNDNGNAKLVLGDVGQVDGNDHYDKDSFPKTIEKTSNEKKDALSTSTKIQLDQLQQHHNQRKHHQQHLSPKQLQPRNHPPPPRRKNISVISNNTSGNSKANPVNHSSSEQRRQQQQQQQQRRRRCSTNQDKKRLVRHLYSRARTLEKMGSWNESSQILYSIITKYDPYDAHSYLALARLEGRRERASVRRHQLLILPPQPGVNENDDVTANNTNSIAAREIFQRGTTHCPRSIHLWHAWAMHEMSRGNISLARTLFDKALVLDPQNGYVCHAYGMMEMQEWRNRDSSCSSVDDTHHSSKEKAEQLWKRGMEQQPSAALITSLGQLYVSTGRPTLARDLYATSIPRLSHNDRERTEVYIASASLEEHVFRDAESARNMLKAAVNSTDGRRRDSRAYVALAKLGTDFSGSDDKVVKGRLKEICMKQWREMQQQYRWRGTGTQKHRHHNGAGGGDTMTFQVEDGRLFNAWAKLESKTNLGEARRILRMGIKMYPKDHALLQAAGNVEERRGNVTAARDLYSASLHIELSAPALIAYALLELRSPEDDTKGPNITMVRKLFNEALLIDPKHGPVYNAFGNLERRQGNADMAKQLYEDGISANCTDASSVYHGLAKLHLSLGEVEEARSVLQRGMALFGGDSSKNSSHNKNMRASSRGKNANVAFLAHTLALIELNCNNNPTCAKSVLEQGLWHCGSSSQLLLAMALCESRLGNDAAARTMFEKSLMADQCHAQAWQSYGLMEMRAGNFKSAKTLFECGLKKSPTHGALWQAYGEFFLLLLESCIYFMRSNNLAIFIVSFSPPGTLESWKGNISEARL